MFHRKPNDDAEILARTLLDVLNSAEGRVFLEELSREHREARPWVPTYVIDEQDLC